MNSRPAFVCHFSLNIKIVAVLFCLITTAAYSADSSYLKVHFLYGSKPLKKYKHTEKRWFGGVLGGHVGIEGDSNQILNFKTKGKLHLIAKPTHFHSTYAVHSREGFYAIFGGHPDSAKKTIVYVPVSPEQKKQFDSITVAYLMETPYDYAFIGMRCGAASYEILGQLGIMPAFSRDKTYKKIFYPKKLRIRLLRKAAENGWTVVRQEGSGRRRWEQD